MLQENEIESKDDLTESSMISKSMSSRRGSTSKKNSKKLKRKTTFGPKKAKKITKSPLKRAITKINNLQSHNKLKNINPKRKDTKQSVGFGEYSFVKCLFREPFFFIITSKFKKTRTRGDDNCESACFS